MGEEDEHTLYLQHMCRWMCPGTWTSGPRAQKGSLSCKDTLKNCQWEEEVETCGLVEVILGENGKQEEIRKGKRGAR